jgi:predicted ArsR family transcriptional regulator
VDLLGEQRAAVVRHVKDVGDATVPELAELLSLSEVATRRHVDRLADDGLLSAEIDRSGRGRPVKRWALTRDGDALFPHHYAEVAHDLLAFLARDGRAELGEFLRWRQEQQVAQLRDHVDAEELRERLEQLAGALSAAGYRADVEPDGEGFTLRQSHCTIADVARDEPLLCAHEAAAFGRVLGEDVRVTRRETMATGDTACVCHVTVREPISGALPVLPVDSPTTSCSAAAAGAPSAGPSGVAAPNPTHTTPEEHL